MRFYCLLFGTLLSITGMGQPNTGSKPPSTTINPEALEVRDSAGTIYPTFVWQQLTRSGKYGVRIMPDRKTALLVKYSSAEINERFSKMPKPVESRFFRTGEKITPFREKDMLGNRFNLKELIGKVVVLNFWFINCPPCRMEMPELNEMVEEYKMNPDVVFIAVALDSKYDIEDFLKSHPFAYHIIDNGGYIAQQYGINSYPTHAVVDRQGKVLFHTTGLATNTVQWVKKSIDEALVKQ